MHQFAYAFRRGGIPHQEGGVDPAREQSLRGILSFEVKQPGRTLRTDVVGLEQGQGQTPRSAALPADRDTPAL